MHSSGKERKRYLRQSIILQLKFAQTQWNKYTMDVMGKQWNVSNKRQWSGRMIENETHVSTYQWLVLMSDLFKWFQNGTNQIAHQNENENHNKSPKESQMSFV